MQFWPLFLTLFACSAIVGCNPKPPNQPALPPTVAELGEPSQAPPPKSFNALYLRAFKSELELEVWIQAKPSEKFALYHTYPVLKSSGRLGPKRKEFDGQVPEGYYFVDRFNPNSQFHLSLGLNYPNASDLIRSDKLKPGSDIFIHGSNVSIGCLAMGNMPIEEIYAIAATGKKSGNRINVHIFPFRLTEENLEAHGKTFPEHVEFWRNELKPGYDKFNATKLPPKIRVGSDGKYTVSP